MYKPFANADSTFRLLGPVQRAPSVLNTQPWWFRIVADDRIELCARVGEGSAYQHLREHDLELKDTDRRLSCVDPESRELIMSCGAALCNLRLAIRVAGHDLAVQLLPYPQDRSVLATVEIVTSSIHPPNDVQQELYDAISRRHSDRWPYGGADRVLIKGDPVSPGIVEAMELAVARYESRLRVLSRSEVARWLREAESADGKLRGIEEYAIELSRWTNEGDSDSGLPASALGPAWAPRGRWRRTYPPVRNFEADAAAAERASPGQWTGSEQDESLLPDKVHDGRTARRYERRPQLLLLSTRRNQPLDWLRAGQALQHALLTATRYGVSASFLTQPFELRDHDAAPRPGATRPEPLEFAAAPSSVSAANPDDTRMLPPPKRDRGPRHRPTAFPEYPQIIMRVGYSTHEVVITPREDPDVLDCRCDPPRWLLRGTGAGPG